jgi:3-deoxy-D-manno-octulosonic-acid transferase
MSRPARSLLGPTWRSLGLACANSGPDAERLAVLGVPEPAIRVTGDPGIDSAAARFDGRDPEAPYLTPFAHPRRPTVVAGSSWPSDEAVLLPAMHAVRESVPDVRMVVAPHEPDAAHVVPLVRSLEEGRWRTMTLTEVERAGTTDGADAVVVDRVGVLAPLYGEADVAFVGGGFHDAGLHSVLEPAAACVPVVFGPRHHNARAAGDLIALGGAKIAADHDALARIVIRWLQDEAERKRTGRSTGEYIAEHRGAASRCADHVASLIDSRA